MRSTERFIAWAEGGLVVPSRFRLEEVEAVDGDHQGGDDPVWFCRPFRPPYTLAGFAQRQFAEVNDPWSLSGRIGYS